MNKLLLVLKKSKSTVLVLLIVILTLIVWYKRRGIKIASPLQKPENPIFVQTYPNVAIETLWLAYRDKIQKDGRTIDRARNYLTTSEAQSYSLLRSVWMDDQDTFDRVLKWTNNNLRKREGDSLFAWKWGQDSEGNWDVLYEEGGLNTATDADQDIALALIFASKRWNNTKYMDQARQVLLDIWNQEVLVVNGEYYLLAGNWAKSEVYPTINPSYFSFGAYPIFADVDPSHPWLRLKDTSYKLLNESTLSSFGLEKSVNLPPDWFNINPETGEIIAVLHDDKSTDFADDAYRIPWRVGLDWTWHRDIRALEYLRTLEFLKSEWENNNQLYSSYSQDGYRKSSAESDSMYGAVLPYFNIVEPSLGQEVYNQKIASLYNPDTENFNKDLGYYAQNWIWFGIAFNNERLSNLYDIQK